MRNPDIWWSLAQNASYKIAAGVGARGENAMAEHTDVHKIPGSGWGSPGAWDGDLCAQNLAGIEATQGDIDKYQAMLAHPEGLTQAEKVDYQNGLDDATSSLQGQMWNQQRHCPVPITSHEPSVTISSDLFCAQQIYGDIYQRWTALDAASRAVLGPPLHSMWDGSLHQYNGVRVQYFQRGMIYVPDGDGAAVVCFGLTYAHYMARGGPLGVLGAPLNDTVQDADGQHTDFAGGTLYAKTGAYTAHLQGGAVAQAWLGHGGSSGRLGHPVSDTAAMITPAGAAIGRYEGGVVYHHPQHGSAALFNGPLLNAYVHAFGGVDGPLGFPLGDQADDGTSSSIDCQHGMLYRGTVPDSGPTALVGQQLVISRVDSKGSDGFLGLGGSIDLQIFYTIVVTDGNLTQTTTGELGGSDGFGDGQAELHVVLPLTGAQAPQKITPSSKVEIRVHFEGWDKDSTSDDDQLGSFDAEYTYDKNSPTGWTVAPGDVDWHAADPDDPDTAFLVDYLIEPVDQPVDLAKFRMQAWWQFHNFDTDKLSWTQFSDTYSDVNDDESDLHVIDHLVYDLLYHDLAQPGNCYGMCVEAIYGLDHRSLFTEPIHQFPVTEANVTNEINIKHGYQRGWPAVKALIAMFLESGLRDPARALEEINGDLAAGRWPMIYMTSGGIFHQGHVVLAYAKPTGTAPSLSVPVANPNDPVPGTPDSDIECQLRFDTSAPAWSLEIGLHDGTPDVYSGGDGSGGAVFAVPFDQVSSQPASVGSQVLTLLDEFATIILMAAGSADAGTAQIGDPQGRSFFHDRITHAGRTWDDIQPAAQRIPGLGVAPTAGGGAGPAGELWQSESNDALAVTLRANADGDYTWGLHNAAGTARVQVTTTANGTDQLALSAIGTSGQTLSFTPSSGPRTISISIEKVWAGKRFDIGPVTLAAGQPLSVQLTDCGSTLIVTGGAGSTVQVSTVDTTGSPTELLTGRSLPKPAIYLRPETVQQQITLPRGPIRVH